MKYLYIRFFSFLFIFLSSIGLSHAQDESDSTPKFVNEFLNIGVGARAHGMFGSVVANVSDINAGFWNPAGLSRIDVPFQASAMHAEWFGGIANFDYIAFGKQFDPDKESYGSISLIRLGIDQIPNTLNLIGPDGSVNYDNVTEFSAADYAVYLSYAQAFGRESDLRLGGSVKIINRSLGGFGKAWGFGLDIGAMYEMGAFQFGLMAKDITSTFNAWTFDLSEEEKQVFEQTGNVIPESSVEIALPRFILAAAYNGGTSSFSYLIETNINISTDGRKSGIISSRSLSIDPSIGAEFGINEKVFVRLGIGNIQRVLNEVNGSQRDFEFQPNLGLGLVLGKIKVDYALTNVGSTSGVLVSHVFSLGLDISRS